MPQTFQDAIALTRSFGMRYLWIDSLCIIQDDQQDWEVEAQTMGDVYRNARLTVAAVAATCADTGLFFPVDGRLNRPCYIGASICQPNLPSYPPHARKCYILADDKLERNGAERADTYRPRGPLDRRGWVLQEEVL